MSYFLPVVVLCPLFLGLAVNFQGIERSSAQQPRFDASQNLLLVVHPTEPDCDRPGSKDCRRDMVRHT